MNGKMLGLLFGLVGVFARVGADEENYCKKECTEMKFDDCAPLCYAGPRYEEDMALDVMGAAIYGFVNVQASEIALLSNTRSNFELPVNAAGIEPDEKVTWGFKAGAGLKFRHDDWKIVGRYNWFKANYASGLFTAVGGSYFPSIYSNFNAEYPDLTTDILNFRNLDYNTKTLLQCLNVYLIRPTMYTALLEISPYFGVDYINTNRQMTILFTNDNPQIGYTKQYYINGGYFQSYNKNRFWGVGPMAGVYSNWYLGYNFGLFSDAYFGVTYGNARSFSQIIAYRAGQPTETPVNSLAKISNSLYQYAPHMDLQMGFCWSTSFDESCVAASLKVAYESAYYFQTNKMIFNSVNYGVMNGAGIGLQNLVLQGQLDF